MTEHANAAFHAITRMVGQPITIPADINERASASVQNIVDFGARLALKQPWRIAVAVYPHVPMMWPVQEIGPDGPRDRSPQDVLSDCRERLANWQARGRAGHWTADNNRIIALRQAEAALLAMVGEGA